MLKFTAVLIILCAFLQSASSQEFLPFATSNYAGVTGLHLQPASIADSRLKFDFCLGATSIGFYNNYMGIDPYAVMNPTEFKNLGEWDNLKYVKRNNNNGQDKSFIFKAQQDLFSFMITLSPKDAIAFTPTFRTILNVDNMSEDLAIQLDKGLKETSLWYKQLSNANLGVQANSWVDYGVTYARIITSEGKHFLKAGFTVKLSQGLASAYAFAKDLNYKFSTNDTLSLYQSNIKYGASDNIYQIENGDFKYKFLTNLSLNFDFGFVYEFRPDWLKYKYDMDGKTNLWRRDQEKYLVKVGFSMTDIGSVRYRRNNLSSDFQADKLNWDIVNFKPNSIHAADSTLHTIFPFSDVSNKFAMRLPTAISLQVDVRASKGLYVNFSPYFALNQGSSVANKVHYYSAWNITPRYDTKFFGVTLPMQYTSMKQWNMGLGIHLGPIWIGSNDILSYLLSDSYRYGASVSVALKMPLMFHKPHDRDGDKVSDRKDKCPKVPGVLELQGCPDTDGDGVGDDMDKCPDVKGLKELDGCPDSDGDGVIDSKDDCPDVKGLPQFNGCPDSDGDGIIDKNDDCPFNAGPASLKGCPDTDGDGVLDKDDKCPTVPGTIENQGCPFLDSDGDGVRDEDDHCPGVKGPVENFGCPYPDSDNDGIPDKDDDCPSIPGPPAFRGCPDTDGDGISDKYDLCPTIPGVLQNNGCPEIKKEEQAVITKAFDNLEFETGKAVIKSGSTSSLNELASLLKKKAEFKLLLAGHTDNVGKPEANMLLSKNRTLAVMKYLLAQGVDAKQIKTEWYGQTKPVADNSSPEGRQRNRRVEMTIVFE